MFYSRKLKALVQWEQSSLQMIIQMVTFLRKKDMRYFLLFIVLLFCHQGYSQSSKVKVTLKSGTVVTGKVTELVVTDHIKLVIAGIETTIPMSKVASLEEVASSRPISESSDTSFKTFLESGKYEVEDNNAYPDSFNLEIEGQKITMVLVRGGTFNMGYDGKHSLSMKSEPVHTVKLSSFYISKQHVNNQTASKLLGFKTKAKKLQQPFSTSKWDVAYDLVSSISAIINKPYRLPTEAEWEYTSLQPFSDQFFGKEKYFDWCYDFWSEYTNTMQINHQVHLLEEIM